MIDLVLTSAPLTHLISSCCTLTHEKVRSDHVPVFFEGVFDKEEVQARTKIIKQLKKVDWKKWTDISEERFRLWYEDKSGDFDSDVESFYSVLNTLILDAIPEKEVKISSEKSKPCWWNNSVKLAKNTSTIGKEDSKIEIQFKIKMH